ncbi:uncharacterized protein LOC135476802 [Liolophura sinensis]|uniref:uncharacterized protein LOC135476802 n=1 Tax=Liolophura sinensis TaxID=3198878 RepID=UPI0031588E6E
MVTVTVTVFPVILWTLLFPSGTDGHGRLVDPPNRGTMWRFGFDNPPDFQDHELNCGGQKHQWEKQNGRCGVCGDPYDIFPRPHEAKGRFANGIIVDTYEEGATITITLDITAPHKGWFQFKLCPVNNKKVRATQSCLDRYPLKFSNGDSMYFLPKNFKPMNVTVRAVLPAGLTCSQCVLQWKYHTGKDWGCDKPDKPDSCCVGCGPQEEFYGCSDVAIVKRGGRRPIFTTKRPTFRTVKPTFTKKPTFKTTRRPVRTIRPATSRPVTARPIRTTTQRRTTPKRTFIWQRTTRPWTKPRPSSTSKVISWWKRPTTRRPYYTRRPTTRAPQQGKYPSWEWKRPTTTTKKHWWQY